MRRAMGKPGGFFKYRCKFKLGLFIVLSKTSSCCLKGAVEDFIASIKSGTLSKVEQKCYATFVIGIMQLINQTLWSPRTPPLFNYLVISPMHNWRLLTDKDATNSSLWIRSRSWRHIQWIRPHLAPSQRSFGSSLMVSWGGKQVVRHLQSWSIQPDAPTHCCLFWPAQVKQLLCAPRFDIAQLWQTCFPQFEHP